MFSVSGPLKGAPENLSPTIHRYPDNLSRTLLARRQQFGPSTSQPQFRNLEALVVASPTEQECVLQALARVGLSLTRPPGYIFELLQNSSEKVSILDPDIAHRLLLVSPFCLYSFALLTRWYQEKVDNITQASEGDKGLLLEYLLSTKNVLNICDLPLVPVANGEKVTISNVPSILLSTPCSRAQNSTFLVTATTLYPPPPTSTARSRHFARIGTSFRQCPKVDRSAHNRISFSIPIV
jgi:hypothetical protein